MWTAALINSMNAHNAETKNALDSYKFRIEDHCGNVSTLFVWVVARGEEIAARYLLSSSRGVPLATSNVFRKPLPSNPVIFDDPEEFIDVILSTENVAKSIGLIDSTK